MNSFATTGTFLIALVCIKIYKFNHFDEYFGHIDLLKGGYLKSFFFDYLSIGGVPILYLIPVSMIIDKYLISEMFKD
tara:strand:- start:5532 stop:5762 length:231 start_codon:yes stop_codon:yes gene_type:complete